MNRPYILLNIAMSADGKISTSSRERVSFSNKEDFFILESLRRDSDAVLVGSTTLRNDNPSLSLKKMKSQKIRIKLNKSADPIKIAISKYCDIKSDSNFLQKGNGQKMIFTTQHALKEDIERVKEFAEVYIHNSSRVDILKLLKVLNKKGIRRLMIEGGGETNYEFLQKNVVDELRIAICPTIIGGKLAPTFVDGKGFNLNKIIKLRLNKIEKLRQIIVLNYKIYKSKPLSE